MSALFLLLAGWAGAQAFSPSDVKAMVDKTNGAEARIQVFYHYFKKDRDPKLQAPAWIDQTLDAMVKRIDSFHDDYDALPTNLAEVGLPPQGDWTWAPRGAGQYSVTVKMFGQSLTFDTRQR